jgi:flavin reductase (DIM6/NTAB) family NADH-FMN oxidoreductase RutF
VVATGDAGGEAVPYVHSFASVSLSPPLVLRCLVLYSPGVRAFPDATGFAVSFPSADQGDLSRRCSSRIADHPEGVPHTNGEWGVPPIKGCAAALECRHEARRYVGDRVIS